MSTMDTVDEKVKSNGNSKAGFILYLDQAQPIQALSLEQKGMLLDAFFAYNAGLEVSIPDPVVTMAFAFFRQTFERDAERYDSKCRKNKENIARRYTKSTTVYDGIQPDTKATDRDTDRDSDTDRDRKEEEKENTASAALNAAHSPRKSRSAVGEGKEPGYRTRRNRLLTGKRLESFLRFWAAFGYSKGKAEAADAWLDIPALTDTLVGVIVAAATREAANRPQLVTTGHTPKWAQGWITARRWEDDEAQGPVMKTLEDLLAERNAPTEITR